MRLKIARALRKWADLFDPSVNPSQVMTIRVECDTSDFERGMHMVRHGLAQMDGSLDSFASRLTARMKEAGN